MKSHREHIEFLCTCAGMIMEDASVEAIAQVTEDPFQRTKRLAGLRAGAADVDILVAAAEVLNRLNFD